MSDMIPQTSPTTKSVKRARGRGVWLLPSLWLVGFLLFLFMPPETRAPENVHSEAILALTGGEGRFQEALRLLDAGVADQLFVSGVFRGNNIKDLLRMSGVPERDLSCCVTLGYEARDTVGNADEAAAWMRAKGFTRLRLVTSDYHVRRAALEIRMAMPEAIILLHPVAAPERARARWWQEGNVLRFLFLEYNKLLVTAGKYVLWRLHLVNRKN